MLLNELFDDDTNSLDVENDIKQNLMDVLTPMVAAHVPFVTIQQIIDKLSQFNMGISIDRNFIMTLLDPDKIKIIDKIEGDRVYLSNPKADSRSLNKDDSEDEKDHVNDLAKKQASKNLGDKNKPAM